VARIQGFIQPPPNAGGPKVDTSKVTKDGVDYQRQVNQIGGSDADAVVEPTSTLPASNAVALPVRHARANFDTGLQAPNASVLVAAANLAVDEAACLDGIAFENVTGESIVVGAANGAGQYLVAPFDLAGGATEVKPQAGRPIVGLKWLAPAGVLVQAWGQK
jgi:hypothetical protein